MALQFSLISIAFLLSLNNSFVTASHEQAYISEALSFLKSTIWMQWLAVYFKWQVRFFHTLCHQHHFTFIYIEVYFLICSENRKNFSTIHHSWRLPHKQGFILDKRLDLDSQKSSAACHKLRRTLHNLWDTMLFTLSFSIQNVAGGQSHLLPSLMGWAKWTG